MNKLIFFKILAFFLILSLLLINISLASNSIYVWSTESKKINEVQNNISKNSTVPTSSSSSNLNLNCGGAVLIEQHSGKVLYNHNMHVKLRPASVTKVMTILLIMEAIDSGQLSYTDKISCSEIAAGMGGSQIWLDTTETLTVDEMLKAICVVSANDYKVQLRHKKI